MFYRTCTCTGGVPGAALGYAAGTVVPVLYCTGTGTVPVGTYRKKF